MITKHRILKEMLTNKNNSLYDTKSETQVYSLHNKIIIFNFDNSNSKQDNI